MAESGDHDGDSQVLRGSELLSGSRAAGVVLGATTAAALGALTWGVFVERTLFTVRQEVLPVLEPGARPLTILHLSDLHMAPWQRKKQDFVRSLARYEPDLIVDTGDNLGHVDGLVGIRRAFEPCTKTPGMPAKGSSARSTPLLPSTWPRLSPVSTTRSGS